MMHIQYIMMLVVSYGKTLGKSLCDMYPRNERKGCISFILPVLRGLHDDTYIYIAITQQCSYICHVIHHLLDILLATVYIASFQTRRNQMYIAITVRYKGTRNFHKTCTASCFILASEWIPPILYASNCSSDRLAVCARQHVVRGGAWLQQQTPWSTYMRMASVIHRQGSCCRARNKRNWTATL